jgi:hypothetical protein
MTGGVGEKVVCIAQHPHGERTALTYLEDVWHRLLASWQQVVGNSGKIGEDRKNAVEDERKVVFPVLQSGTRHQSLAKASPTNTTTYQFRNEVTESVPILAQRLRIRLGIARRGRSFAQSRSICRLLPATALEVKRDQQAGQRHFDKISTVFTELEHEMVVRKLFADTSG